MFYRFVRPAGIEGRNYEDGDIIEDSEVPDGSRDSLLRSGCVEKCDPPVEVPEVKVEETKTEESNAVEEPKAEDQKPPEDQKSKKK